MRRRPNLRLVLVILLVAIFAYLQISKEHRPSFLRPGLRMMAYVTNTADGTVSAIDLIQLAAVGTIPVGPAPSGVRSHPTRHEIWGVSTEGGYVWIIDAPTGKTQAQIPVGAGPFALDFSPDGHRAFVAASGSGTIAAIDSATRKIVAHARTGRQPWIARVSPDGKLVVVPNREDGTVTLLRAADLSVLATIVVAPLPEQVVILPDSQKAFVSASSGNVSVVDLRKKVLLANLPLSGQPTDILLKSDGGEIFVPTPSNNGLAILNTWTNEFAEHLVLGTSPWRGSLTDDARLLYLSDAAAGRILPVQINFRLPRRPIAVGQRPGVSRLTPGEELLLVVNEDSNDVSVVRTRDNSLLTLIPVGRRPRDLAIKVF